MNQKQIDYGNTLNQIFNSDFQDFTLYRLMRRIETELMRINKRRAERALSELENMRFDALCALAEKILKTQDIFFSHMPSGYCMLINKNKTTELIARGENLMINSEGSGIITPELL